MSLDRHQQVKQWVQQLIDLPPTARREQTAAIADGEIRSEVEAWLAADEKSPQFAQSLAESPGRLAADWQQALETQTALPERIGRYEVVREIGRGGMGVVYEALRRGEFEKRVAIKVLGVLGSKEMEERFRREEQILAQLDHEGIARILDAGVRETTGQPYLVMEYVDGTAWRSAMAERKLEDRLRLFVEVCEAVQAAHQGLIVHRDLKPENILVTHKGRPKLLDFGISKILGEAGATTVVAPMTPEYASPEQMAGMPVTVQSDVYALGLILFEAAAGHPAYRLERGEWAAMARSLAETAIKVPTGVPSDLAAIIDKALRKDPRERYRSVEALAADVQRFLRGEAVEVRWNERGYRAWRFTVRNRLALATTAIVVLALAAGLMSTIRAQQAAERRFREVRQLASGTLFEIHGQIRTLSGSLPAQRIVVETARRYLDNLAREASNGSDADLERELAEAYLRIGQIYGDSTTPNFGRAQDAEDSFRRAEALARSALQRNVSLAAKRALLQVLNRLLVLESTTNRLDAAIVRSAEVLSLSRDLNTGPAANLNDCASRIRVLVDIADMRRGNRQGKIADELLDQALRDTCPARGESRDLLWSLAGARSTKALLLGEQGNFIPAEASQLAALAQTTRALQLAPKDAILLRQSAQHQRLIGRWRMEGGNLTGVREAFEEARRITSRLAQENPEDIRIRRDHGQSLVYLLNYVLVKGPPTEAVSLARERLVIAEELLKLDATSAFLQSDLSTAYTNLGLALEQNGQLAEARDIFQRGVQVASALVAQGNRWANEEWGTMAFGLARIESALGLDVQESCLAAQKVLQKLVAASPQNWERLSELAGTHRLQAANEYRRGRRAEAARTLQTARQLLAPILARSKAPAAVVKEEAQMKKLALTIGLPE